MKTHQEKITLHTSMIDAVALLSNGNPGALVSFNGYYKKWKKY